MAFALCLNLFESDDSGRRGCLSVRGLHRTQTRNGGHKDLVVVNESAKDPPTLHGIDIAALVIVNIPSWRHNVP